MEGLPETLKAQVNIFAVIVGNAEAQEIAQAVLAGKEDAGPEVGLQGLGILAQRPGVLTGQAHPEEVAALGSGVFGLGQVALQGGVHGCDARRIDPDQIGDISLQVSVLDQIAHDRGGKGIHAAATAEQAASSQTLDDLRMGLDPTQTQAGGKYLGKRTERDNIFEVAISAKAFGGLNGVVEVLIDFVRKQEKVMMRGITRAGARGVPA